MKNFIEHYQKRTWIGRVEIKSLNDLKKPAIIKEIEAYITMIQEKAYELGCRQTADRIAQQEAIRIGNYPYPKFNPEYLNEDRIYN